MAGADADGPADGPDAGGIDPGAADGPGPPHEAAIAITAAIAIARRARGYLLIARVYRRTPPLP